MQKFLFGVCMLFVVCSCDYSTSSNGNIDAAFAREEKPANSGNEHHEGHVNATEHKNDNPGDHVETQATQGEDNPKVVPTDTSAVHHEESHH